MLIFQWYLKKYPLFCRNIQRAKEDDDKILSNRNGKLQIVVMCVVISQCYKSGFGVDTKYRLLYNVLILCV